VAGAGGSWLPPNPPAQPATAIEPAVRARTALFFIKLRIFASFSCRPQILAHRRRQTLFGHRLRSVFAKKGEQLVSIKLEMAKKFGVSRSKTGWQAIVYNHYRSDLCDRFWRSSDLNSL
jgi:hypothetical protein